ncbi:MAG: 2-hydroxyacid dehydrogenase [Luteitalea sp.]|nr:2-hydroxyacid dehydrogenase [Luteitalea sp.]
MRVAVFSTRTYDRQYLEEANRRYGHDLTFLEMSLDGTTVALADGFPAICVFVNDQVNADVIQRLADGGTQLVALRSAGFNHVDVGAAHDAGMTVVRVPAYSPHAVAEHTVALMLTLNRKIHRAYARVREGNFALGQLLGFDLHDRTVGVVGTGRIGTVVARIMGGFGCRVLAFDPAPNPECERNGARYVPLRELLGESDIVTLHCPLTPKTHHLIDGAVVEAMKRGVMLINTSRGALIDTRAVIAGLKSGAIGYLGLDVYEEEGDLFFRDLSDHVIQDDVFARLLTFPNVVITAHQAFFTIDALRNIAETTLDNIRTFEQGHEPRNLVTPAMVQSTA